MCSCVLIRVLVHHIAVVGSEQHSLNEKRFPSFSPLIVPFKRGRAVVSFKKFARNLS